MRVRVEREEPIAHPGVLTDKVPAAPVDVGVRPANRRWAGRIVAELIGAEGLARRPVAIPLLRRNEQEQGPASAFAGVGTKNAAAAFDQPPVREVLPAIPDEVVHPLLPTGHAVEEAPAIVTVRDAGEAEANRLESWREVVRTCAPPVGATSLPLLIAEVGPVATVAFRPIPRRHRRRAHQATRPCLAFRPPATLRVPALRPVVAAIATAHAAAIARAEATLTPSVPAPLAVALTGRPPCASPLGARRRHVLAPEVRVATAAPWRRVAGP